MTEASFLSVKPGTISPFLGLCVFSVLAIFFTTCRQVWKHLYRAGYDGIPVTFVLNFIESQFVAAQIGFQIEDFIKIEEIFVKRYGRPTRVKNTEMQNAMRAKFTQPRGRMDRQKGNNQACQIRRDRQLRQWFYRPEVLD